MIPAYQLLNIDKAYIYDIYEDKILYELTSEDIAAITTAYNEAFDTIQEHEWDLNYGWSAGVSITINVSEKEQVHLYTSPEPEQFIVAYSIAMPEGDRYHSTEYNLKSSKLLEVYDTIIAKYNRH